MTHVHLFIRKNRLFMQKTVSYYCMHLTVAIIVAYAITRDWKMSLAISLLEPTVQAFAYFFHERIWARGGAKAGSDEAPTVTASG